MTTSVGERLSGWVLLSPLTAQISHCAPSSNLFVWCSLLQQKAISRQIVSSTALLSPVHRAHALWVQGWCKGCSASTALLLTACASTSLCGWRLVLVQEERQSTFWHSLGCKHSTVLVCSAELILMFLQTHFVCILCVSRNFTGEDGANFGSIHFSFLAVVTVLSTTRWRFPFVRSETRVADFSASAAVL